MAEANSWDEAAQRCAEERRSRLKKLLRTRSASASEPQRYGENSYIPTETMFTSKRPTWTFQKLKGYMKHVSPIRWSLELSGLGLADIPKIIHDFKDIHKIAELDISRNNMDSLPAAIKKMKGLKILKADLCGLNNIPYGILGQLPLERVSFKANNIKVLPEDICDCSQLRALHLQFNKLEKLPDTIGKLEYLESLETDFNALSSQEIKPQIVADLKKFRLLRPFTWNYSIKGSTESFLQSALPRIDLQVTSRNCRSQGQKTSHTLVDVLNMMDSSAQCNPTNILSRQKTWQASCPKEVSIQGFKAIKNYYKEYFDKKSDTLTNRRCRVIVLGDRCSGKSSFVDTLIAGKSKLTKCSKSKKLLEQKLWHIKSAKDTTIELEVQFSDFGNLGVCTFEQAYQLLFTKKSVAIICVRADTYSSEKHSEYVTSWVERVSHLIPQVPILLIATHSDQCENKETAMETIYKKIFEYEASICKPLADKISQLDRKVMDCQDDELKKKLEKERSKVIQVKDAMPWLPDKVLPVSSKTYTGFANVQIEILKIFEDKTRFPEEIVPKKWHTLLNKMKTTKLKSDKWYFTLTECVKFGKDVGLEEDGLRFALEYMHRCGEILWYAESQQLQNFIFHLPAKLIEILTQLTSLDISHIIQKQGRLQKDEFDNMKKQLQSNGLMSTKLLKELWHPFKLKDQEFNIMMELLVRADLCFPVNQLNDPYDLTSCDTLLFPMFLSELRPSIEWDQLILNGHTKHIIIWLKFPFMCPSAFYPILSVRLNKFVKWRRDWKNGVNGVDGSGNSILLEIVENKGGGVDIQLSVCGQEHDTLWQLALPVHLEMCGLLEHWPGVLSQFMVPCPGCIKNKESEPFCFSDEYLWKCSSGRLRCHKGQEAFVDPRDVYPSHQVLEGLTGIPMQKSSAPTNEETRNFLRLFILVARYGAEMIREILERCIQPKSFEKWVMANQTAIYEKLKKSMWMYKDLFPNGNAVVQASNLDITTLVTLFRKLGQNIGIPPPKKGWDGQIDPEDQSVAAYIIRLSKLRNDSSLAHNARAALYQDEFEAKWKLAEQAVVALGGRKDTIARIKQGDYDNST